MKRCVGALFLLLCISSISESDAKKHRKHQKRESSEESHEDFQNPFEAFGGAGAFDAAFSQAYQPFLMQMLATSPFFHGTPNTKHINPSPFAQVDVRSGPVSINPTASKPSDPIIIYGPQPQVPLVPLYPPPPPAVVLEEEQCEFDEHNNRCCNRLLKATMNAALAPIPVDSCNIALMAKLVQKKAEEVFKMDFESLAAYKDFKISSHYVGNYTCKINRHGKSIMAFASPNEENENPQKRMTRIQREEAERQARDRRAARITAELKQKQEQKQRPRKLRRRKHVRRVSTHRQPEDQHRDRQPPAHQPPPPPSDARRDTFRQHPRQRPNTSSEVIHQTAVGTGGPRQPRYMERPQITTRHVEPRFAPEVSGPHPMDSSRLIDATTARRQYNL